MPRTRLFIGSSAAAKSQAKAIIEKFQGPTVEFVPGWEAFTAGDRLLGALDTIAGGVDGALMVFSPESESVIRVNKVSVPNLNVLAEFTYFYGRFGKEHVAMVKYGDFYLPTDFGGYIHIFGSTYFRRSKVTQVGKRTETEFGRWIGAF